MKFLGSLVGVVLCAGLANAQCGGSCGVTAVIQPAFQQRVLVRAVEQPVLVPAQASNNIAINTQRGLFGRNNTSVAVNQNGGGVSNNIAIDNGRRRRGRR